MAVAVPLDVVISFDTTGSMSQALDEVKARVNDLVQRLQSDIPGIMVGIIAHGDYCDAREFYTIRTLDLTSNVADVVTFVSDTTGTGGGDVPECYELALRHARNMSWRAGSRRALVVIGDAYPHESDYELNTLGINWADEVYDLAKRMNIHIYGVQYGNDPQSAEFFKALADTSFGQYLPLKDMGHVCHVIMGICYREHDGDLLLNYQAEVQASTGSNISTGLGTMFDKLGECSTKTPARRQPSMPTPPVKASNASNSASCNPRSSLRLECPPVRLGDDLDTSESCPKTPDTVHLGPEDDEEFGGLNNGLFVKRRSSLKRKRPAPWRINSTFENSPEKVLKLDQPHQVKESTGNDGQVETLTCRRKLNFDLNENSKSSNLMKSDNVKQHVSKPRKLAHIQRVNKTAEREANRGINVSSQIREKARREYTRPQDFKFKHLCWSGWQQAVANGATPGSRGVWRPLPQRVEGCIVSPPLWRVDVIRPCVKKAAHFFTPQTQCITRKLKDVVGKRGIVFEVGIKNQSSSIKPVWYYATNERVGRSEIPAVLSKPWYSSLTRGIKGQLTKAVVEDAANVYIRWVFVDNVKEVRRSIEALYSYLWR